MVEPTDRDRAAWASNLANAYRQELDWARLEVQVLEEVGLEVAEENGALRGVLRRALSFIEEKGGEGGPLAQEIKRTLDGETYEE